MKPEALLLLSSFVVLAAAPFLPALVHLLAPESNAFIDIPPDRDDDPRHFSKRLKALVDRESTLSTRIVHINDATTLTKLLRASSTPQRRDRRRLPTETRIVVLGPNTVLSAGDHWLGDTLSQSDIVVPTDCTLRTLRAEGQCLLHAGARILRWLDARALYVMGPGRLPTRATASQSITLSTHIAFERLHAPLITVGERGAPATDPASVWSTSQNRSESMPLPTDVHLWRMDSTDTHPSGHQRFKDNTCIAAGTALRCDVVCERDLHLGPHTRLLGNLKVKGDLFLHAGASIQGHVLCQGSISLDSGCRIDGVMTALKHLNIAGHCTLGSERSPTSLIADTITLHAGVCIHGQVWARSHGVTDA